MVPKIHASFTGFCRLFVSAVRGYQGQHTERNATMLFCLYCAVLCCAVLYTVNVQQYFTMYSSGSQAMYICGCACGTPEIDSYPCYGSPLSRLTLIQSSLAQCTPYSDMVYIQCVLYTVEYI